VDRFILKRIADKLPKAHKLGGDFAGVGKAFHTEQANHSNRTCSVLVAKIEK
jgi:hypothetical protein